MDNIFKGKLKRWNDDRGFGFIIPENGNGEIFIHISALKNMSRHTSPRCGIKRRSRRSAPRNALPRDKHSPPPKIYPAIAAASKNGLYLYTIGNQSLIGL
ncbi:MAG: cold shock domain-containing protein [Methylobacter sp.]